MNRRDTTRGHVRRSLLWRVFYGSDELAGEGSVLDMHETGCRIAGCMPVEPGMKLRLCMWPSEDSKDIVVAQGCVKWAKGLQFGVALETPEWKGDEQDVGSLHPEFDCPPALPFSVH